MERRSEMKRRFIEHQNSEQSVLERVGALEKSFQTFCKEVNAKLDIIQQVLRLKNVQNQAQKTILDYESVILKKLDSGDGGLWEDCQMVGDGESPGISRLERDVSLILDGGTGGDKDESADYHQNSSDDESQGPCPSRTNRRSRKRKPAPTFSDTSPQQSTFIIKQENIEVVLDGEGEEDENEKTATAATPRKKQSGVWNYYVRDMTTSQVHCTLCKNLGVQKIICPGTSGTTTGMWRHVSVAHGIPIESRRASSSMKSESASTNEEAQTAPKSISKPISKPRKHPKGRKRSFVWKYFLQTSKNQAECLLCKRNNISKVFVSYKGSTTTFLQHLSRVHDINSEKEQKEMEQDEAGQNTVEVDLDSGSQSGNDEQELE